MASTKIEREIQAKVDQFVADLSLLIRKAALESVEEALGGARVQGTRVAARSASPSTRKGRKKRSASSLDELTKLLLGEIKGKPGQRIEEIARSMRTTTKDLALPAKRLLSQKRVKTSGQKRATKYFPR